MEISETKKSNKYAALVTYLVAIVCLLLGLFLPLFNGNGILALSLPDVLNQLIGSEVISAGNKLDLSFSADLFGLGVNVDIMAYVIFLYAVVTLLGLLALVPIGLAFNKQSKVPVIFEYIILTASTLVLSLYVIMALQLVAETAVSLNLIIAFGGSLLALMVLSCINKKGAGVAKLFLCLFSAVALLLLFDLTVVIPALKEPLESLGTSIGVYPALFRANEVNVSAIDYFTLFFAGSEGANFSALLGTTEVVAEKIMCCAALAAAIIVLFNFFIDVISLSTNGKKVGLLFNIVRYGLAFLIIVLLIIMTFVCKYNFGLFTITIAVIVTLQLLISVLRFIMHLKKVSEEKREKDFESQKIKFVKPVKQPKQKPEPEVQNVPQIPAFVGAQPIVSEPIVAETIEPPKPQDEQMAFIEPAPEVKEEPEYEEPLHETPGEVQMEMDGMPEPETHEDETFYVPEEKPAEQPEGSYETQEEYEKPVYIGTEEVQPEQTEEPVQTYEPVPAYEPQPEPTYEQPAYVQPVQPVVSEEPEPVAQPEPEVVTPVYQQPVYQQPIYQQPVYQQPAYVQPVQKVEEPKPAPAPTPVATPAPTPAPAPAPAPVPVRVEVKPQPAQDRTARPYIDKRIYSEMYEQSDSFISKLSDAEKVEFTRTFIERANGDLANIPEYVIGGNNKKFFSAVFIYLGRIRGMISDGLLNKMFKELNML
ncbi:MAG: hypothetical protein K2L12_02845 [Clostridia bacterium]|nr:hypothetical protein [Clostridia bacterium]